MQSQLGESRVPLGRGSVGEQKFMVRYMMTGCALILPASIIKGFDNIAIFVEKEETLRSSIPAGMTDQTSHTSADVVACACLRYSFA